MVDLTQEQRATLAQTLPAGYSLDNMRWLELTDVQVATALATADDTQAELIAAAIKRAGPAMIGPNGRPTILNVAAWACHAGAVNANGDSFVGSELEAMAPALFRAPNFGVMDWNHSAVKFSGDDPKMIGVWYDAQYRFNEKAQLWGLQVTGMMFAWLFPEQADSMMADQARNGTAKFSMACIPQSVEFGDVGGRQASILHNPIFFTVSALNKPPADKECGGMVSETPEITPEQLKETLMAAASVTTTTTGTTVTLSSAIPSTWYYSISPSTILAPAVNTPWVSASDAELAALKEASQMHEEAIKQLETEKAELQERLDALLADMEAIKKATSYTRKHAGSDQEIDALIDSLTEKVAALEVTVTELTTTREALAAELAAAQARVTELETAKATADAQLAEVAAAEAAKVVEAKLAARIAELPEAFVEAHAKRSEEARKHVETRWASMTDEEWEFHKKEELLFGFTGKVGFVQRSKAEGHLISAQADEHNLSSRLARLIKR